MIIAQALESCCKKKDPAVIKAIPRFINLFSLLYNDDKYSHNKGGSLNNANISKIMDKYKLIIPHLIALILDAAASRFDTFRILMDSHRKRNSFYLLSPPIISFDNNKMGERLNFMKSSEIYFYGSNDLISPICHNAQENFKNIAEPYLIHPFHN